VVIQTLSKSDPNMEFSIATKRILLQDLSVCERMLVQRKRKAKQTALDSCFAKRVTFPA
jgi:hypothetical protein